VLDVRSIIARAPVATQHWRVPNCARRAHALSCSHEASRGLGTHGPGPWASYRALGAPRAGSCRAGAPSGRMPIAIAARSSASTRHKRNPAPAAARTLELDTDRDGDGADMHVASCATSNTVPMRRTDSRGTPSCHQYCHHSAGMAVVGLAINILLLLQTAAAQTCLTARPAETKKSATVVAGGTLCFTDMQVRNRAIDRARDPIVRLQNNPYYNAAVANTIAISTDGRCVKSVAPAASSSAQLMTWNFAYNQAPCSGWFKVTVRLTTYMASHVARGWSIMHQ
jgi:hypothetical protein